MKTKKNTSIEIAYIFYYIEIFNIEYDIIEDKI